MTGWSCEIERFRQNFRPTGCLKHTQSVVVLCKKLSSPGKPGVIRTGPQTPKMAKHKFASISLTVPDRAILSKFSTHRESEHCTLGNF